MVLGKMTQLSLEPDEGERIMKPNICEAIMWSMTMITIAICFWSFCKYRK